MHKWLNILSKKWVIVHNGRQLNFLVSCMIITCTILNMMTCTPQNDLLRHMESTACRMVLYLVLYHVLLNYLISLPTIRSLLVPPTIMTQGFEVYPVATRVE